MIVYMLKGNWVIIWSECDNIVMKLVVLRRKIIIDLRRVIERELIKYEDRLNLRGWWERGF